MKKLFLILLCLSCAPNQKEINLAMIKQNSLKSDCDRVAGFFKTTGTMNINYSGDNECEIFINSHVLVTYNEHDLQTIANFTYLLRYCDKMKSCK